MRIRRIQLMGLAAAVIGAGAGQAQAEDRTIIDAQTGTVRTSDPVAGGAVASGNVTINTGGSLTVTAGTLADPTEAIIVDSDNNVTNNGAINSTGANHTIGIRLTDTFAGTVTGTGSISLLEDYTPADTDNDGEVDEPFAIGTNRIGILLDPGTFTGNIDLDGAITIEGTSSAAIRLDGRLDGDGTTTGNLLLDGAFTVTGDNSVGILIGGGAAGGVAGDALLRGGVVVRGENAVGLVVDAQVDGEMRINGLWSATGFRNTLRPANVSLLDPDDLLVGGSAIAVNFSVLGGLTVEGRGVEDDLDDDGDSSNEPTDIDDDRFGNINSFGSAPAIHIAADASANLVLGPTSAPGGYGFHNRGTIHAEGVYDGFDATGLRIEGILAGSSVTTAAGVANDGQLTVTAFEADAYGLFIGANASAPTVLNRGAITSAIRSAGTDTAYAMYFASDAIVGAVVNNGFISTQAFGEAANATAIFDQSGSVTSVTNTGSILADVIPIAGGAITGSTVAIDLSNSVSNILLEQLADTPFTDDDAVDDDAAVRPATIIRGDVLFGTGNDTFHLYAGSMQGDLEFGDGVDTFIIDNGAIYSGSLADNDGVLSINVIDGQLNLGAGVVSITSAAFDANSVLGVVLNATQVTADTVTFVSGAQIVPIVPDGLPDSGSNVFLNALTSMTGGAFVVDPDIEGEGIPFVYNLAIELTGPAIDGAPNGLRAVYELKTAAELGFNSNEEAAFDPIIEALRLDSDAATAFASLDNEFDFFDAYEDLMPSFASGATELAATAIQQMQSATTNRLSATRLHDLDEVSAWAQEIGYGLDREPPGANGQAFRGHGFGLAAGIDGPLNNGGLFGLSGSFITSEVEEPGRPEGEISATFGQLNAYYGTAMGPIDLDFVAGAGVGRLQSRRFVEIGSTFSALSEADWWGYEGHGAVRASVPMRLADWLIVTPQAALTYVALNEEGYTEEGGGVAIDYEVDSAFSQRLWGDVGLELAAPLRLRGGAVVAPRLYAGWRANLIDEEAERSFRFVSGGNQFTLMDEGLGDGGPLFGIGIDATNGFSTFTLAYEGEFGDQVERHSLNAAIRFRF